MGILRDVIDVSTDLKDVLKTSGLNTKRYSSLSKRSMEGTLQFPVLVSRSMDIDTLQIVSKALERQYASFVQVVLSMNPDLNLDVDKDVSGYLRKFHQNMDTKTDLNDFTNFTVKDSATDGGVELLFSSTICEGSTGRILTDNRDQLVSMLDHVREDSLNNKFIPKPPTFKFSNENLTVHHNKAIREADGSTKHGAGADGKSIPDKLLRDNDVRKSNELVPTTLHIRVVAMSKNENQGYRDFIIGVKTTMHPVASDEMMANLLGAVRNQGKFFNFVRWTSGETNFFKDFLFNIREIKDDVVNRSSGSSPWWIALKRRASLAKLKDRLLLSNQILPNASIVVSMEEVEAIRSQYGFDFMDIATVDKVMKKYFLLGFVVVDNSAQIAHFMFDGQTNYQSVSFSGLEKENSTKTDLRDVMKILDRSKMV